MRVLAGERWNSQTQPGLPGAKALIEGFLVDQGLKLGYRQRLETVLVLATNFADRGAVSKIWPLCAKAESSSLLESMPARVKFKRIGGVPYITWNMRFNSIPRAADTGARARVSPFLTIPSGIEMSTDREGRSRPELCMATRSLWSDLLVSSDNGRDPARQVCPLLPFFGKRLGAGGTSGGTFNKPDADRAKVGPYAFYALGDTRVTMAPTMREQKAKAWIPLWVNRQSVSRLGLEAEKASMNEKRFVSVLHHSTLNRSRGLVHTVRRTRQRALRRSLGFHLF